MESHVRLLIEDLALSTRDTDETLELYAAHADTLSSTKRLDLAYRISRLALGKDKVSRPTVEQEIVSENWYVILFSLQPLSFFFIACPWCTYH